MARLKFLLFALPVIGLWGSHLYRLSPVLADLALNDARARTRAAPEAVAQSVLERRVELQRLTLRAVTSPVALGFAHTTALPASDKVLALFGALEDAAPEPMRKGLVVAVSNDQGALWVRGGTGPSSDTSSFDLKTASEAGPDGTALDAFGSAHLFYAVALAVPDRGTEPRVYLRVVVGAPLVDPSLSDALTKETGLSGIALMQGGKVLQAAGAGKALLEKSAKDVPPASSTVLSRGAAETLGPFQLPVLTQRDWMGGQAALQVAAREAIPTTPYEVVALASVTPAMEALARYQRVALFALFALVLLSLVWTVLMGSDRGEEEDSRAEPHPVPQTVQSMMPGHESPSSASALPVQDAPPPEASPDDFPFGAPPPRNEAPGRELSTAPGEGPGTGTDPFAPAPPPPPGPGTPFDDFDNQPTRAFTVPQELKAQSANPPPSPASDFNPDQTRVAAIPDELLRASARTTTGETALNAASARPAAAPPPPRVSQVAPPPAGGEEQHFQEVYREFLATRERCGEPADGLTFEKFALKLRKNKDQLVQKYNCRTVRFQVYVKEGKAALKATPVKD